MLLAIEWMDTIINKAVEYIASLLLIMQQISRLMRSSVESVIQLEAGLGLNRSLFKKYT